MSIKSQIGVIKSIIPTKSKGNIMFNDNGKTKSIPFFTLRTQINNKKTKFIIGDIVQFDIISRNFGGVDFDVAENLVFVENKQLDNFLESYDSEREYKGFLKKYDNTFYVKESHSYIQFKVNRKNLTPKYIIPEENTLIKFNLKGKRARTLKANILNLQTNPIFLDFRKKEIRKAIITNLDKNYIHVKLINFDLVGVINIKDRECPYKIGESIFVIYAGIIKQKINFKTVL